MRVLLLMAVMLPFPAQALEYCEDLWFTRNLLFHQAGYCFGSSLGKAIFGNEGCRPGGVDLDAPAKAMVQRIRTEERIEGCKVDTNRFSLPIPLIEVRKTLIDPPFPSLYESGCIGWKADPIPLYSGRDARTPTVATVRRGDTLLFQFEDQGDWSFVEITQNGLTQGMGWAQVEWSNKTCDALAG